MRFWHKTLTMLLHVMGWRWSIPIAVKWTRLWRMGSLRRGGRGMDMRFRRWKGCWRSWRRLQPRVDVEKNRGRKSLKGSCAATVLSITIVALAGGCNNPRSTPEGTPATPKAATTISKDTRATSTEIWPTMVGKQITIRGKLLPDKIGWYILLDNQQEVYFP